MKKLLALLLCVMLFVSVIPTSAFAAAINLKPAYDAMGNLNVAYAKLATAAACKNAYDAATAYEKLFSAANNENAHRQAGNEADYWAGHTESFVNAVTTGMSYEGIWQSLAPEIYTGYEYLGNSVVHDTEVAVQNAQDKIVADVTAEIAKLEASMTAAMANMFAAPVFNFANG